MIVNGIQSPAQTVFWLLPGHILFLLISSLGLACFAYILAKRIAPLIKAQADLRFDHPLARLGLVLKFWLGQWNHPRYRFAGTLHILIFGGFLILITRAAALLMMGIVDGFVMPGVSGEFGHFYNLAKDYAATVVLLAIVVAAWRRGIIRPARYAAPAKYGKGHAADAVFLLSLIGLLMLADSLYEASAAAAHAQMSQPVEYLAAFSLPWFIKNALISIPVSALSSLHSGAYLVYVLTFFFLLCSRPFGVEFHVETSLFSIYFARLNKQILKPVRWGVAEERLDEVKSFGVKTFEDFTWKHMLDFYSCADCGRCSDQCPANAVGRPLSPRFLTKKARDYSFRHYPVFGRPSTGEPLIGEIYSEDEIWSCTTCGACETECPLLIEYIDKIVDLRRGLIEEGNVPQSLQKPLKALKSRGNPYGKSEKKRGDWTKVKGSPQACEVRILNGECRANTLYFVDSMTSYDDRMQSIGRATARVLSHAGENFGILGAAEKDSGHEARRFGEETLFMALRDHNSEAIKASGVERIVTADPHAYNALAHDYRQMPPVEHISQVIAREIKSGKIRLGPGGNGHHVYTFHDPCYLGRHNQIYDAPREALDAIPGLRRVEMQRCKDRSFCCGGGGLMLFYEPQEDERMGVKRVRMAAESGADVIVTACPFCMANLEDAVKVAGMEETMAVIDLAELIDQHIVRESPQTTAEIQQPTSL